MGVFGIGKESSGTADPYGLRRAALGLLRVALARRYRVELRDALAEAQRLHGAQRERGANNRVSQDAALVEKIWGFLAGRLETLWRDRAAPDSIQAVLHTRNTDVVALEERLSALTQVREKNRTQFESTAATFKRIPITPVPKLDIVGGTGAAGKTGTFVNDTYTSSGGMPTAS